MSTIRYRYDSNRFFQPRFTPPAELAPGGDARAFHRALPGYAPTPLVSMPVLAEALGLKSVWVKDESKRFGLNAFKALGASYAVYKFLKSQADARREWVFATATDGNHGRAVAWTARRLGHKAVVFVPRNTVKARIDAIRGEGAEVAVVDGTYDETVKHAAAESEKHGWQVISDTAYPGYMQIPAWIMEGYTTLFEEAQEQIGALGVGGPHAVFVQAGVGGLACSAALFYQRFASRAAEQGAEKSAEKGAEKGAEKIDPVLVSPVLISVEPLDADCLLESIASPDGSIRQAKGGQNSIMAGLNCGTPSLLAWPVIRSAFRGFLAVDDDYAKAAMRRLAGGTGGDASVVAEGDASVVAGESGAAGLAGLLALCQEPGLESARKELGLGKNSRVLILNTEGDTDPENYRRIVVKPASGGSQ